jgi:subtilisin family serine protease
MGTGTAFANLANTQAFQEVVYAYEAPSVALALAGTLLTAAAGLSAAPRQFLPLHNSTLPAQRQATVNPAVDPDGQTAVIIILKDDPATVTYGKALKTAGGSGPVARTAANNAARSAIANLVNGQTSFVSTLNASKISYTEIFRVQRVLNGIAVRVKPEDIDKVRALPNVVRVEHLPRYNRPENIVSVPFVNAPEVWAGAATGSLGLPFDATGKGVKIGDIDTGLDFIHPDFGGTGLLADYQDVDRTSVIGKNSHNVIFPTAKVVGGIDLAGDLYDAVNVTVPTPDPNPMDCGGHGSHTAGTLAGLGVNSNGTPYTGVYNTTAPYAANLKIGPGMAPQADLYAIRVFGCGGSTNLVTEAIEWATDPNNNGDFSDHLDVINMSLGSDFGIDAGNPFDSDVEAVNNAALIGLVSVSAAGNSGDTFFINGSPGSANVGVTAAASVDNGQIVGQLDVTSPTPTNYAADLAAYTNLNMAPVPNPSGQSGSIVLVNDGSATPTLGCFPLANAAAVAGKIALIDRGTCSFIAKAQNAQLAGAIAIIVANNSGGTTIQAMGGTGANPAITIPGISVSQNTGTALKADASPAGKELTLVDPTQADTLASFSSRGPVTTADGVIEVKPDIAAPGLNIPSVQSGITCTGSATDDGCITPSPSGFIPGGQVLTISGTSMATPHIAGLMALLRQLNPDASVEELKAMAINGAAHDVSSGNSHTPPLYGASRVGAGRIDAAASATSKVIAFNSDVVGAVAVTFDIEPVGITQATHNVTLENRTNTVQSVTLAVDSILTAPGVSYSVPSGAISIPANGRASFVVTLSADVSQMLRYIDPTMATAQSSIVFGEALPRQYIAERSALIKVLDSASKELARLPVYTAIRPHSTMTTAADLGSAALASGTTALTLSGQDVCTGTITTGANGPSCSVADEIFGAGSTTGEESFVSPFELQFTGAQDSTLPGWANIHYVGVNSQDDVLSDNSPTKDYFFGIATYAKWGTPTDAVFNVCVDTDNDGLFDKIIADVDLGTLDQIFDSPTANSPEDTFVSFVYDNTAGNIGFSFLPNFLAGNQGDTGVLSNNTISLPAYGGDLALPSGVTKIHYGIAACPGFNALCGAADWTGPTQNTLGVGTAHCGDGASYASFDGPFSYDAAKPAVDGQGNALLEDLNGATLAVNYNANNLAVNGSTGMLLLHTHNTAVTSAEVVLIDRIFANGFESN